MDMVIIYGDRFKVEIGDADKLAKKILYLKNIIDNADSYSKGTIDLTDPDKDVTISKNPF